MNKKNIKTKEKSSILRLLSYTKKHMVFLVIALISAVISVCSTLYVSVLVGRAIDSAFTFGKLDFSKVPPILFQILIFALSAAFFQWLMNYLTNLTTHKTVKELRDKLFCKLQTVPLKLIDQTPHGDLMSRMVNDIEQLSDGILQGFTKSFLGIVTILATIGFMFSINAFIALFVIIASPLSLLMASFIAKKTSKYFKVQASDRGELSSFVEETISGQSVVKAFGYEDNTQGRFDVINKRLHESGVKSQLFSSLTNPCTRYVNSVIYAIVGIAGAILALSGGFSLGMISVFLGYANQYTKPFNEISGVMTELQSASASAKRVFAFLDEENEPNTISKTALKSCEGNVAIENVSFSYSKERPLIENLNVTAKSGQRIAIVGPTGCGKTTIINLLMRFYDVNSGAIKVDGVDTSTISRDDLRVQFGMVLQDTWLFSGTIEENIAYSKANATREEVVAAAKLASAHSFIKRLENGYDTIISSDGENLSGGQRQLLCIARVMLALPPMLILDEATSSIDTLTEQKIQKAFTKMMEGRTSFVVAHRLSTIIEADCILVMNQGNIIEQGTHDELIAKNGFYSNLYSSQFKTS